MELKYVYVICILIICAIFILYKFIKAWKEIKYEQIVERKKWKQIWSLSKTIIVDNRDCWYYKKYGFHEYDTTADFEEQRCKFIIEQHDETKEYRILHDGQYIDTNLEEQINNKFNELNGKL